jgi:hypothetical protein
VRGRLGRVKPIRRNNPAVRSHRHGVSAFTSVRAVSCLSKMGDRDRLALRREPSQPKRVMLASPANPPVGIGAVCRTCCDSGPFNASPGRELVCGDAGDRHDDTCRRFAEKANGEKLNCERRETASG